MRLFRIEPDPDYEIYTGHLADGTQILAGPYNYLFVIIYFDAEGNLLRFEDGMAFPPDPINQPTLEKRLQELQLIPESITVHEFLLEGYIIGVKELTKSMERFLKNEEKFSEEERNIHQRGIDRWRSSGEFVLYWLNDYWCDVDGFITAT